MIVPASVGRSIKEISAKRLANSTGVGTGFFIRTYMVQRDRDIRGLGLYSKASAKASIGIRNWERESSFFDSQLRDGTKVNIGTIF